MNDDRKYFLTYERVSTDDQAVTKSCDDQKTVNDRFIESNGWKLAEKGDYRDEGISGSTLERPGLQDLFIRCQEDKTIKGLIVTETDRLARGNDSYIPIRALLKKCDVKMVAVTQPMIDGSEEGEMFGEIMGAINGFFSKITRRKSMRALDEKAERGWYPSWAPLGYKNVNIGTEDKPERIIQVDEEKAPYVKRVPKLYNQGLSYQEIADLFYNEGLRGKANGKVSSEEVRNIILSDFYLGEFTWRGKRHTNAKHPPLFDYLEVQRARQRSQEKGHVHTTPALKDKFLFKKLPMFCHDCKVTRITAECKVKHYRKRDAEYVFYHCTRSLNDRRRCSQPPINKDDLIGQFAEKVVRPIEIGEDLAEFIFEEMNKNYLQNKNDSNSLL
ncbi:recombinase family protein [Candidatus Microgenomates bacterium]|nr:recombinase family protein [Candidatus Microgenomates bacterium]